jgi:hypothetical protein
VPLAAQNNRTRSRTDSALAASAGMLSRPVDQEETRVLADD